MTDPTSKSASQPPPQAHAPYTCPHCNQPADDLMATVTGPILVFWHKSCTKILSVQPLQHEQRRIVQPTGRLVV